MALPQKKEFINDTLNIAFILHRGGFFATSELPKNPPGGENQ